MSSIPDIGDQPIEHDPTGVRALLAALPDPGPMPADLVARIQAALAAEPPFGLVDDVPTRAERSATVIPFAAADATKDEGILRGQTRQQRRRIVLPWLAAAAAAGIFMVSGTNLLHDHGSSIAAAFGSSESSAGSAAASSDGRSTSDRVPLADKDAASGTVTVQRSGASYTSSGLAAQASGLTVTSPTTLAAPTVEGPTVGPLGTPLGARDCAAKHGVDRADPLTVDLTSIDGTPGIVVVAQHSGARTAYAFSMSCEVLAGPVSVP